MKRIGILGGSSDQATADYYRKLNAAVNLRLGGYNTAELLISSMNFAFSADCVRQGKWDEVGAYLKERAAALETAGAEILLCVSNTLHKVAPIFSDGLKIPFLHIGKPTGEAIRAASFKRVALLGTKTVMAGEHMRKYYSEHFGIETIVPDEAAQNELDRIIFDELCRGQFPVTSRVIYLEAIDRLRAQGAEGVILGCTEIPLLIAQGDRPGIPMFDTTALHVDAAVDLALA